MLVSAQHGLTETSGRFRMACDVAPGPNVRVHKAVFQVVDCSKGDCRDEPSGNVHASSWRAVEQCGRGHA